MIIIPAIDIFDGQAVRLYQGDYKQKEIVGDDPRSLALRFECEGAQFLHLVDLDGAKTGSPKNFKIIKKIASAVNIPCEVGGGIRTEEDIEIYLHAGVSRVIIGSQAVYDFNFIKNICPKYNDKIVIGVDSKDGFVMTCGWLEKSQVMALDFIKKLEREGVKRIIFTDISRDGTLTEPNYDILKKVVEKVKIPIIASGGVRDLTQLERLAKIGVEGVIVGRAIYAGTLNLKEAIGVSIKLN